MGVYIIHRYKDRLQPEHKMSNIFFMKFGFLFQGYDLTRNTRYWEIMVVLRKMLVLFVIVFFPSSPFVQGLLAQLVLVVALLLHVKYNPFDHPWLNLAEFISLLSSFSIFFLGELSLFGDGTESIVSPAVIYALSVMAFIICVGFLGGMTFVIVFNGFYEMQLRKELEKQLELLAKSDDSGVVFAPKHVLSYLKRDESSQAFKEGGEMEMTNLRKRKSAILGNFRRRNLEVLSEAWMHGNESKAHPTGYMEDFSTRPKGLSSVPEVQSTDAEVCQELADTLTNVAHGKPGNGPPPVANAPPPVANAPPPVANAPPPVAKAPRPSGLKFGSASLMTNRFPRSANPPPVTAAPPVSFAPPQSLVAQDSAAPPPDVPPPESDSSDDDDMVVELTNTGNGIHNSSSSSTIPAVMLNDLMIEETLPDAPPLPPTLPVEPPTVADSPPAPVIPSVVDAKEQDLLPVVDDTTAKKKKKKKKKKKLPANWKKAKSGDGKIYFFNTVTEETTWTRPE
jgi:hypothetical protein